MVNEQTLCKNGRQAILALAQNVVGPWEPWKANRNYKNDGMAARKRRARILEIIKERKDLRSSLLDSRRKLLRENIDDKTREYLSQIVIVLNNYAEGGFEFVLDDVFFVFSKGNFYKNNSIPDGYLMQNPDPNSLRYLNAFEYYYSVATIMENALEKIEEKEETPTLLDNTPFPVRAAENAVNTFKEVQEQEFPSFLKKLLDFLKQDIILTEDNLQPIFVFLNLKLVVKERGLLIEFFNNLLFKTIQLKTTKPTFYTNQITKTQELYYYYIWKYCQSPDASELQNFGDDVIEGLNVIYEQFPDEKTIIPQKEQFVKEIKKLIEQYRDDLTPKQQAAILETSSVSSPKATESEESEKAIEDDIKFVDNELEGICSEFSAGVRKDRELLQETQEELLQVQSENEELKKTQSSLLVQSGSNVVALQEKVETLQQTNKEQFDKLQQLMNRLSILEGEKEEYKRLFKKSTGYVRQLLQNSSENYANASSD
jgi:hypothetical protein